MSYRQIRIDRETFIETNGSYRSSERRPISHSMPSAATNPRRATLRLVGAPYAAEEWGWFCGHCGARRMADAPAPIARVCGDCGLGLLLEARVDAIPDPDDAFLVIDSSLTVQAMSSSAEIALGVRE